MHKKGFLGQSILHIIFVLLCLTYLIPFLLLISISITDEQTIISSGYNLIPPKVSFEAYKQVFQNPTQLINSYRTTASMNGMVFSNDGRIGYYDSANKIQYFKDEKGNDLTFSAVEWYHITNKFDFKNVTITYYLDGVNLGTVTPPNAVAMSKLTEICYKGLSNKTDPGTTYFDNFRISQEQA